MGGRGRGTLPCNETQEDFGAKHLLSGIKTIIALCQFVRDGVELKTTFVKGF